MESQDSTWRIELLRRRYELNLRRAREFRKELAAEVVAAVAAGMSVTEAARIAGVTRQTVYTWRSEHPDANHQTSPQAT